MTGRGLVDRESAEAVFLRYAPLFERLDVCGVQIWAATVDELLGMKRDTVSLYGVDIESSSRPHDFIDIASLESLAPPQEEGGLRSRLSDLLGGWR